MTALNQEKRAVAKQFLTDLKDFLDIDAHALKPKTKLDKFWELEAAEVFAHFRVNKIRLKDSDEEKIRTRFQKAKDTLVPLESSLAFTDDLIDQIVYHLYGLTPEEIKLVEASQVAPTVDAKTTLFKQVLPQLKEATLYFTTAAVVGRVKKLGLKISEGTLPVYLSEATASGLVHDAGRGWYSALATEFKLDTKPVAPLVRLLEKQFPLLDFHCWATVQINPYMHHLLGKSVTFVNTDGDAMEAVAEFLRNSGYDAHLNPRGDASEKFTIREKTVVVRKRVLSAPADNHFARIETLLVDLLLETQRLGLMDVGEFRDMARAAASSGRISMSDLAAYAADRKQTAGGTFGDEWIN